MFNWSLLKLVQSSQKRVFKYSAWLGNRLSADLVLDQVRKGVAVAHPFLPLLGCQLGQVHQTALLLQSVPKAWCRRQIHRLSHRTAFFRTAPVPCTQQCQHTAWILCPSQPIKVNALNTYFKSCKTKVADLDFQVSVD